MMPIKGAEAYGYSGYGYYKAADLNPETVEHHEVATRGVEEPEGHLAKAEDTVNNSSEPVDPGVLEMYVPASTNGRTPN